MRPNNSLERTGDQREMPDKVKIGGAAVKCEWASPGRSARGR
jgi:hypothetical protein